MPEFEVNTPVPKEHIGWLETELPKSVMMKLQSYIETAKENPVSHNDELAGNITKSLTLKDKDNWFFENILIPLIRQFSKSFPLYIKNISLLTENAPYCLQTFWVNFQKQHEFNPIHNHNGVFSFVIWVKIPTDWREQHALPFSNNSNCACASDFEFIYPDMFGANNIVDKDVNWNSQCIKMWPQFRGWGNNSLYNYSNCLWK